MVSTRAKFHSQRRDVQTKWKFDANTNTEGMGLCPWGALGGGNFKSDEQRKEQEGRKMGEASPEAIKISKVLEKIANKNNTQITSVALAYVMNKTPYVFPIIGVSQATLVPSYPLSEIAVQTYVDRKNIRKWGCHSNLPPRTT